MVVYLPIAFLKDWLCNFLKHRSSKSGKNAESVGLNSPVKYNGGQKSYELELPTTLTRKDSEADLSPHAEGKPLVAKQKDEAHILKQDRELTPREIATYGFYIAPIWFITEVSHLDHLAVFFKFIFSILVC